MMMRKERDLVVEYGKKLITSGLTKGTGGNVSVLNKKSGVFAISPSGMDYFETSPEQVALVSLDGTLVDAPCKPSSELELHRMIYLHNEDAKAVVHAHSDYATALSCLRIELPSLHYLVAIAGHRVPCADYATFGSVELAKNVVAVMTDCRAVLMANHGSIAAAASISTAFRIVEEVEFCAKLYLNVLATGREPVLLSDDEMERNIELFATYGQGNTKDK